MAFLVSWLVTTILGMIALPFPKAALFGVLILLLTLIGQGVVMLPLSIVLSIFVRDLIKRKKIIDSFFMPFQFLAFLIVLYFAYKYNQLLVFGVIGGYLHWYFSYKHQEKQYKRHMGDGVS